MHKVTRFTHIGFQFNSCKDSGVNLDIEEVQIQIENKNLFPWLQKKLPDLDISRYSQKELDEIGEYFYQTDSCYGSNHFGVKNDGLLLLVAYCLEGAQNNFKP